jgi:hypothetical protein
MAESSPKTIRTAPNVYFKLQGNALFTSNDAKTWKTLLFDPSTIALLANGTVVVHDSKSLWMSEDSGKNWILATNLLQSTDDYGISKVVVSGDRLYVTYSPFTLLGNPARIVSADVSLPLSSNMKWSWSELTLPCSFPNFLPSRKALMALCLVLTGKDRDVFVSFDDAATWRSYGHIDDLGFSVDENSLRFMVSEDKSLLVSSGDSLFALTSSSSDNEWIDVSPGDYSGDAAVVGNRIVVRTTNSETFKSDDWGRHWSRIADYHDGLNGDGKLVVAFGFLRWQPPQVKRDFVETSGDGGAHWARLATSPPERIDEIEVSDTWIMVHGTAHVYRKHVNGTDEWSPIEGLAPNDVRDIVAVADVPVLVGTALYLVNGKDWASATPPESSGQYTVLERLAPTKCFWSNTGVFLTSDAKHWTSLKVFENESHENQLINAFKNGDSLYVLTRSGGRFSSKASYQILVTKDMKSWSQFATVPEGLFPKSIAVDSGGISYIRTANEILRCYPQESCQNVYSGVVLGTKPVSLAVDSRDVVFLGTSRGLFWTSDHGLNWNAAESPSVKSLRVSFEERVFDGDFEVKAKPSDEARKAFRAHSTIQVEDSFALDLGTSASPVPTAAVPLIDGQEVSGLRLEADPNGKVTLRGPSSALKGMKDGVHRVSARVGAATQSISFDAYMYKELAKAYVFKPYQRSFAVIVAASGAWSPGLDKLDDASKQAAKVAQFLSSIGFEVKEFYEEDATLANIEKYINDLVGKAGSEDRVVFYFAGHGVTKIAANNETEGYLLTYPATEDTAQTTALPMFRLRDDYARRLNAKHVLFVLDACFSGLAITQGDPKKELLKYEELSKYTKAYALAILAAGQKDQPALDKNGGIFTTAFLEAIQGKAADDLGVITVLDVFHYVKKRVGDRAALLRYQQTPQLAEIGQGEFVFCPR